MIRHLYDNKDFQILNETCMEIGEDIYLCKAERAGKVVMLFVYIAGSAHAELLTIEKMENHSMEHIRELLRENYYLSRLQMMLK